MSRDKQIPFTKMTGTGNDFILFDNREGHFSGREKAFFAGICRRRLSIGADGVLLLEKGRSSPFSMVYLNSDGLEAPMCGNGLRCLAYYTRYRGITTESEFSMEASDGPHDISIAGNQVSISITAEGGFQIKSGLIEPSEYTEGGFVDTGVPHYVLFTEDLSLVDVEHEAPFYRSHARFEQGANINFVQVLEDSRLGVRTFERGVEKETLSCGTGCVASALIAHKKNHMQPPITTITRGGDLTVNFDPSLNNVSLTAEVALIFEGCLILDTPL